MTPKRKKKSEASNARKKNTKTSTQTQQALKTTKEKAPSEPAIDELVGALEAEKQQTTNLRTKLAYLQAEYQNFQKSVEKRETQIINQANRSLILHLLPVLDDLERAIVMVPVIKENQPSIEGLKMVLDGFQKTLIEAGVKPIMAEGQTFDPLRHEAVLREETTGHPHNMVIEELRRGYLLKGTLLRPSMVRIAVSPVQPQKGREKAQPRDTSKKTRKQRKVST